MSKYIYKVCIFLTKSSSFNPKLLCPFPLSCGIWKKPKKNQQPLIHFIYLFINFTLSLIASAMSSTRHLTAVFSEFCFSFCQFIVAVKSNLMRFSHGKVKEWKCECEWSDFRSDKNHFEQKVLQHKIETKES